MGSYAALEVRTYAQANVGHPSDSLGLSYGSDLLGSVMSPISLDSVMNLISWGSVVSVICLGSVLRPTSLGPVMALAPRLDSDAFSSEDEGVDGPCTRPEHCQAYAQNGQEEVTLVAAWICDRHQQLGNPFKAGHDWGPDPERNANSHKDQSDVDLPQRGPRNGQHHLESLHDQRTTRGKAQ